MLNEFGQEVPDDTPVVIRFRGKVVTQFDQVRDFIRRELSANRVDAGAESFEEANDFDVDDDLFPLSPNEYTEDTEAADLETLRAGQPRSPQDGFQQPVNGGNPAGGTGGAPPVSPLPQAGAPTSEALKPSAQ